MRLLMYVAPVNDKKCNGSLMDRLYIVNSFFTTVEFRGEYTEARSIRFRLSPILMIVFNFAEENEEKHHSKYLTYIIRSLHTFRRRRRRRRRHHYYY
jgi:hypothetical protein